MIEIKIKKGSKEAVYKEDRSWSSSFVSDLIKQLTETVKELDKDSEEI